MPSPAPTEDSGTEAIPTSEIRLARAPIDSSCVSRKSAISLIVSNVLAIVSPSPRTPNTSSRSCSTAASAAASLVSIADLRAASSAATVVSTDVGVSLTVTVLV